MNQLKKGKRLYLFGMLIVVFMLLLGACSSNSSNGSKKSTGNGGNQNKSASGKTQISLGLWGTGMEIKREQTLVNAFMKDNPNIKVKLVYKSWDSYWTWITAQAAAKDLPDVYKMDASYLPKYAQLGATQNLDSLIKSHGFNLE